nr:MAG TPA: hypothetical protein [Caudoviricetes sp.]
MEKDIYRKISSLRRKLHKSIDRTGLNSDETRKISNEMDKLIKEYYDGIKETEYPEFSDMYLYYKKSYKALKNVTEQLERFPTVQEWNKFAKENNYLSHVSIEFVSKLKWNYLRVKVLRELNMKI